MKFIYPLLVIFTLVFCSCSNEKPAKVSAHKKDKKVVYALAPDSIYRPTAIEKALASATPLQKAESRKLFMNGLDLLANKNNPKASIEFFKEAIFYYPDEKSYLHLFEAYIKNGEADPADSINTLIQDKIEYTEATFNRALVAALRKDESSCVGELSQALMEGFPFKDRVTNEPLFDFLKENQSFQSLIVTYFGNDEKMRKNLFKSFIASFPEIHLPYTMPVDSVKKFNYDQYINYDFAMFIPGMEDGRFSRDVSREFMMVGRFNTENGVALLYKDYEVIADTLNPVDLNILLFDTAGVMISNQSIACFCSPLESRGFVINKDKSIDITTYSTKWETDPLEKGYAGNKIVSVDAVESQRLQVTRENKLQELDRKESVASSGK
jgi:hypothetical protein